MIDEVWIVPCGSRPDKPHISPPRLRLEMVRRAAQDFFPKDFPIKIDSIEVEHGVSIPTFFLLEMYKKMYSDSEFWFVMGTDLVSGLHWWHEGQRLMSETKFLIFERNGYEYAKW